MLYFSSFLHVCVFVFSLLVVSKSLQPHNCSPPGSSVHGIFQARILEGVAISFSRGSSQPRDRTWVSCVSCISRWILYHWTIWEALVSYTYIHKKLNYWRLTHNSEKAMTPYSSTLAWKIPWTEEPGRLQSMGSQRVRHDWSDLAAAAAAATHNYHSLHQLFRYLPISLNIYSIRFTSILFFSFQRNQHYWTNSWAQGLAENFLRPITLTKKSIVSLRNGKFYLS